MMADAAPAGSRLWDLNPRPTVYKAVATNRAELRRRVRRAKLLFGLPPPGGRVFPVPILRPPMVFAH